MDITTVILIGSFALYVGPCFFLALDIVYIRPI